MATLAKRTDIVEQELTEVTIDLNDTHGNDDNDETLAFITEKGPPSEAESQEMQAQKSRKAAMSVVFYWVVSLSLVFLNKMVMVGDVINLDAPLFMSWTQFVITTICCALLGFIGKYFKPFSFFPQFEYKLDVARKVFPLTFVFLGMIIFNNLCLKYVEVSFYQVARALTIVFNILFTYLILGKKTNRNSLICCIVIVLGYVLGCDGEMHPSMIGIVFGLLSSAFVALNAIYVKKVLPVVDDNSEKLMIYNNLNAVFILPPIIYLFTNEPLEVSLNSFVFFDSVFWAISITAGIFGFLINFASYLQIRFTSPLSHNVSGTAKAAAQTVIALYVFRNPITVKGVIGNVIVILASFAYSRVR